MNNTKRPIFRSFLLSHLLIAMVLVAIALFTYGKSMDIIRHNDIEVNIMRLSQVKDIFDERFGEIEKTIAQLMMDNVVSKLIRLQNPIQEPGNTYPLLELHSGFNKYLVSNKFISDIYLYNSTGDFYVSTQKIIINSNLFYGDYVFALDDMDYETFYESYIKNAPPRTVVYNQQAHLDKVEHKVMLYFDRVRDSGVMTNNILITLVDYDRIKSYLKTYNGSVYIIDSKDRLVYAPDSPQYDVYEILDMLNPDKKQGSGTFKYNGSDICISYVKSDFNRFLYLSVVPYGDIAQTTMSFNVFIIIIIVVSIGLSMLLSFVLAYKSAKPITDIVRVIMSRDNGTYNAGTYKNKELSLLFEYARGMMSENSELSGLVRQQQSYIKTSLYRNLINEYESKEKARSKFGEFGIPIEEGIFVFVLCKIAGNTQDVNVLSVIRIIVDQMITDHTICAIDVDEKCFGYILRAGDDIEAFKRDIEKLSLELTNKIDNYSQMVVSFSAGSFVNDICDIGKSYDDAMQEFEYHAAYEGSPILWSHERARRDTNIYYPIEQQLLLINAVVSGNKTSVKNLLDNLYDKNVNVLRLTYGQLKWLYDSVKGTFLDIRGTNDTAPPQKYTDFKTAFEALENAFIELTAYYSGTATKRKTSHKNDIVDFVKNNFENPELCLSMLSEHFKLTESYISSLIKSETGYNFSTYCENLRINHACILLQSKKYSVKEVSRLCGYYTPHVFRRVFKKTMGLNPTDYP